MDYILHVTESPQMSFRNWWGENPDFFSSDVFHQLAVPTQSREEGIWKLHNEKNSGEQIQLLDYAIPALLSSAGRKKSWGIIHH